MNTATIQELESILKEDDRPIIVLPNGEIRAERRSLDTPALEKHSILDLESLLGDDY